MQLPKKLCRQPGCTATTERIFCARHEEMQPRRAGARARGYTNEWDKYARAYLLTHPFCVDPFGKHSGVPRAAEHVDHKIPHKGDQRLFWASTNHQSLCAGCHSMKTAMHDGGFGNEKK